MKLSKKNQEALKVLDEITDPTPEQDENFWFDLKKSYTPGSFVQVWGRGDDIPEYPVRVWKIFPYFVCPGCRKELKSGWEREGNIYCWNCLTEGMY